MVIEDDDDDEYDAPPPSRRPGSTSAGVSGAGPLQNGGASAKASSSGQRSVGGSNRPSSSRPIFDDDDDDDVSLTSLAKRDTARPSSNGGAKNGIKKSTSGVPKREGGSSRPLSPSGVASKGKTSGSGGGGGLGGGGGGRHGDDRIDSQSKANKPKKRPIDSDAKYSGGAAKAAHRTPKQEEDMERAREEARKKMRREQEPMSRGGGGGSSDKGRVKVKSEPSRSSSSGSRDVKPKSGRDSHSTGKGRPELSPPPTRDQKSRKFKEMTRAEKIEQAMKVYKWWEEPPKGHGMQWESLEHNGAYFAPEYKPHGVKLKYDGKEVHLAPHQEEVATFYASVSRGGGVRCGWGLRAGGNERVRRSRFAARDWLR